MKRPLLFLAGTAAVILAAGGGAHATLCDYKSCGPFVSPIPGCNVPKPCQVPGKEYSDYLDKNCNAGLDASQVLAWDGQGGEANTFDYDGKDDETGDQVDALAHCQDALYEAVINDRASLLWSTGTPNTASPTCMDPKIYYEKPHRCPGNGVWATAAQVNNADNLPNDVDGLEVWGPELQDDANRFSLKGDPNGTAVFAHDSATGASSAWLYDATIRGALFKDLSVDLVLDDIDLDAMMTWDEEDTDGEFGNNAKDSIMFSLAPVAGSLDGGEIFVYDALGARYLKHGCHLWDTTFQVQGYAGGVCENVNALEAVSTPEPVTLIGLMMGAGSLVGYVRRRRTR